MQSESVLVRVFGPDPKETKTKDRMFFQTKDGYTALSASGSCFIINNNNNDNDNYNGNNYNGNDVIVVTSGLLVTPFVDHGYDDYTDNNVYKGKRKSFRSDDGVIMKLLPDVRFDVAVAINNLAEGETEWIEAQVVYLGRIPEVEKAMRSMGFFSWTLAHGNDFAQNSVSWTAILKLTTTTTTTTTTATSSTTSSSSSNIISKHSMEMIQKIAIKLNTSSLSLSSMASVRRGVDVIAAGSPFGLIAPQAFGNNFTKGIISNNIDDSIYITDCRIMAGMEGGPMFLASTGEIIAIIAPILKRTNKDGSEFYFALPFHLVKRIIISAISASSLSSLSSTVPIEERLSSIKSVNGISTNDCSSIHSSVKMKGINDKVWQSSLAIVGVCVGDMYGSGVAIYPKGYIITNCHVIRSGIEDPVISNDPKEIKTGRDAPLRGFSRKIKEGIRIRVRIDNPKFVNHNGKDTSFIDTNTNYEYVWKTAELIYMTPSPMDVALLKIIDNGNDDDDDDDNVSIGIGNEINENISNGFLITPMKISERSLCVGEKVYVIGHALMSPILSLLPSFSEGIVSRIVKTNNLGDTIILTSALIHSGNSGGALVNSYGELIGLTTKNVIRIDKVGMPHLNMSISTKALSPLISFINNNNDQQHNDIWKLENMSDEFKSIWNMNKPLSITDPREIPNKKFRSLVDYIKKLEEMGILPPGSSEGKSDGKKTLQIPTDAPIHSSL